MDGRGESGVEMLGSALPPSLHSARSSIEAEANLLKRQATSERASQDNQLTGSLGALYAPFQIESDHFPEFELDAAMERDEDEGGPGFRPVYKSRDALEEEVDVEAELSGKQLGPASPRLAKRRRRPKRGNFSGGGLISLIGGTRGKYFWHRALPNKSKHAACPVPNQATRLAACIQPVAIANDDGKSPTVVPSLTLVQSIWEKCCVSYSILATKTVSHTAFKTLDEDPTTNVPTAEASALFAAAGSSNCIQVFVPKTFQQGAKVSKNIAGGGHTFDSGKANPKVVVVEGARPAVVAHEVGHAAGHLGHDNNNTVMKPTMHYNVANSAKVSLGVCAAARTGSVLTKTNGKGDCCMAPK